MEDIARIRLIRWPKNKRTIPNEEKCIYYVSKCKPDKNNKTKLN